MGLFQCMTTRTVASTGCSSGWTHFGSHCYRFDFEDNEKKISDHEENCLDVSEWCHTPSLHSVEEADVVAGILVAQGKSGKYVGVGTSEMYPFFFRNGDAVNELSYVGSWYHDEPNDGKRGACVRMLTSGLLRDRDCNNGYDTLCEAPRGSDGSCLAGWTPFGWSCFKVSTTHRTWSSVEAYCQSLSSVRHSLWCCASAL